MVMFGLKVPQCMPVQMRPISEICQKDLPKRLEVDRRLIRPNGAVCKRGILFLMVVSKCTGILKK